MSAKYQDIQHIMYDKQN